MGRKSPLFNPSLKDSASHGFGSRNVDGFPRPLYPSLSLNILMRLELPIGAFLASALVLLPLHRHVKARNVATVSLVAWLFLSNLIAGINAIIWAQNVRVVVPIWCDIGKHTSFCDKRSLTCCHLQ